MRQRVLIIMISLCVLTLAAPAADVTGKWIATMPGFDGNTSEMVFRFKQTGDTVTGIIDSMRGDETISEGKVSGDTITFMTVERLLPGVEVKTIYKGTIAGNEIKLSRTMDDGTGGAGGGPGGRGPGAAGPGGRGPGAAGPEGRGPGPEGRGGRGGRGGPFGFGELLLKKAN